MKPCCGTIGGFANFSFLKVYWEFSGRPADFLIVYGKYTNKNYRLINHMIRFSCFEVACVHVKKETNPCTHT